MVTRKNDWEFSKRKQRADALLCTHYDRCGENNNHLNLYNNLLFCCQKGLISKCQSTKQIALKKRSFFVGIMSPSAKRNQTWTAKPYYRRMDSLILIIFNRKCVKVEWNPSPAPAPQTCRYKGQRQCFDGGDTCSARPRSGLHHTSSCFLLGDSLLTCPACHDDETAHVWYIRELPLELLRLATSTKPSCNVFLFSNVVLFHLLAVDDDNIILQSA